MDRSDNVEGTFNASRSEVDDFMDAMGSQPEAPIAQPPAQPATEPVADVAPQQPSNIDQSGQTIEPQTPPVSNAELDDIRRQLTSEREAREAIQQEIARRDAYARQQAAVAQQQLAAKQRQDRIDQANEEYTRLIDQGEPERARIQLQTFWGNLDASERQQQQAREAQANIIRQQEADRILAPQYAKHLGEANGLSDADIALLATVDGRSQDRMLPGLIARKQQQERERAELESKMRDAEAERLASMSAFNPGGSYGGASSSQIQQERPTDPSEAEVWDFMNSPMVSPNGR